MESWSSTWPSGIEDVTPLQWINTFGTWGLKLRNLGLLRERMTVESDVFETNDVYREEKETVVTRRWLVLFSKHYWPLIDYISRAIRTLDSQSV